MNIYQREIMHHEEQYNSLITEAQARNWTKQIAPVYTETHHITPKCLNGNNSVDNLVELTAQEHYEAHRLLAYIHPDVKGIIAAWWIISHTKDVCISAEEYAILREARVKQLKSDNPMYNPVHRKKLSAAKKGKPLSESHKQALRKPKVNKGNTGKTTGATPWNKGIKTSIVPANKHKGKYIWVTPFGEFNSALQAANASNLTKSQIEGRVRIGTPGYYKRLK